MSNQHTKCPNCTSSDIEHGDYEQTDVNILIIEVECNDCGNKWFEVYEFMHNENEFGDFI